MSKLIQIENALKAIDQAAFQTLCDDYLHRRGYEAINRIGSALGKKKTAKGTPDTYVSLPNGKYVFVEYTSQERDLPRSHPETLFSVTKAQARCTRASKFLTRCS